MLRYAFFGHFKKMDLFTSSLGKKRARYNREQWRNSLVGVLLSIQYKSGLYLSLLWENIMKCEIDWLVYIIFFKTPWDQIMYSDICLYLCPLFIPAILWYSRRVFEREKTTYAYSSYISPFALADFLLSRQMFEGRQAKSHTSCSPLAALYTVDECLQKDEEMTILLPFPFSLMI